MNRSRSVFCFVLMTSLLAAAAGCDGQGANESVQTEAAAASRSAEGGTGCPGGGNATFTMRVVYNVINSFEQDALKRAGAPPNVKGITRKELLIRDDYRMIRRSGKTWHKDPAKWLEWRKEGDALQERDMSPQEQITVLTAWQKAEQSIPMAAVDIDWVDLRAAPGAYSYRYGLDPVVPYVGERWLEDTPPDPQQLLSAGLFDDAYSVVQSYMEGVEVSTASFAGHDCEMLRRRDGRRVHETCHADFSGHTVYLHGLDKSPDGLLSQTAESVEIGLCVTDAMLAPPTRARLEDVS